MNPRPFRPQKIVRALGEHRVEAVVIGGWAIAAHGIEYSTGDLDLMIPDDDANYRRLEAVLVQVDARVVVLPGSVQVIRPTFNRLKQATGPILLSTRYGRLDLLKESGGHSYASLRGTGVLVIPVDGTNVVVAALADIADMKAKANRPKDLRVLPLIYEKLAQLAK